MSRQPLAPAPRRVPVAVWITLGVVAFHVALFLVVADKHYLPKTRREAPAPTPNFGAIQQTRVDPSTGEVTTETQYVVSARLASPSPVPASPPPSEMPPQ